MRNVSQYLSLYHPILHLSFTICLPLMMHRQKEHRSMRKPHTVCLFVIIAIITPDAGTFTGRTPGKETLLSTRRTSRYKSPTGGSELRACVQLPYATNNRHRENKLSDRICRRKDGKQGLAFPLSSQSLTRPTTGKKQISSNR